MKVQRIKQQQGISLIELLIAFIIITLAILGYVKLHGTMLKNSTYAQQQSLAVQLAQDEIENYRDYSAIKKTAGQMSYEDIDDGTTSYTTANTTYDLKWTVNDDTALGYKTITMEVTWERENGTSEPIKLSSIIAKYDPAESGKAMQS